MRHRVQDGTFDAEQRFGGQGEEHEQEQGEPIDIPEAGSRTRRRSCIAVKAIIEATGDGWRGHENAKRLGT